MLPLVWKLSGQPVVVLGAGRVAHAKIQLLHAEGAQLHVIAPWSAAEMPEGVTYSQRRYRRGDLRGARLAIVAVGDDGVNRRVMREAHRRNVPLNVVDRPEFCDVYFTAVHRDGNVVVSVSSQGSAPALASVLRDDIAQHLPAGLGDFADELRAERDAYHRQGHSTEAVEWRSRITQRLSELRDAATRSDL